MITKNKLASKTLWFNILGGFLPVLLDQFTGAQIITPETQVQLLSIGNFILRFFTKTKVV